MANNIDKLIDLSIDCIINQISYCKSSTSVIDKCQLFTMLQLAPFPSEIANRFVDRMRYRQQLNGTSLVQCTADRMRITEIDLSQCDISLDSLHSLIGHHLQSLSLFRIRIANGSRLDMRMLINQCLNDQVSSELLRLNIGGPEPIDNLSTLCQLSSLERLIVAESPAFGDDELIQVCKSIVNLHHLDISKTTVTDIKPISQLIHLEVLIMHRVHPSSLSTTVDTLQSLSSLCILDISNNNRINNSLSNDELIDTGRLASVLIQSTTNTCWPNLQSIDISGNHLSAIDGLILINQFVQLHSTLNFIGLFDTVISSNNMFSDDGRLKVAGSANRRQSLLSLKIYARPDRESFTAHALQAVYNELHNGYEDFDAQDIRDCVKGIDNAMINHQSSLSVQMAGSACFYHLLRLQRAKALTNDELRQCINRCLDASEHHPRMAQLQKNVWLTLCNDYLLSTNNIDTLRMCNIAFESMINTDDTSVSRMTIAIVSILAPKIPINKNHILVSDIRYVCYLIQIINQHINDQIPNTELKFTLSALWNLTGISILHYTVIIDIDESPETCQLFLKQGGLNALLKTLEQFNNSASIQTKVLGLLNNIAEVRHLQTELLTPMCINAVLELLDNDYMNNDEEQMRIDVSYFSAGILSNLLQNSPWNFDPTSDYCNQALIKTVERWQLPQKTMVAYRSFAPFFPLLDRDDIGGAQLWAVWAIRHVCSSDRKCEYLQMLNDQDGYRHICRIIHSSNVSNITRQIANDILQLFIK